MTATTDTEDAAASPPGPVADAPAPAFAPEPGRHPVDVPLGRRVMVVSDLLLTPDGHAVDAGRSPRELARALDTWDGPGILVIAGNLFDLTGCDDPLGTAGRAIDAHPGPGPGLPPVPRRWTSAGSSASGAPTSPRTSPPGPRVDPGPSDVVASLAAAGVEHLGADRPPHPDRHRRAGGPGRARRPRLRAAAGRDAPTADAKPGAIDPPAGRHWRTPGPRVARGRPVAGRRRPAERPVGPHPLRRVPHPLPPVRPLRLVAARPLRRGPACCGWPSPRGCSATSGAACRPGPSATPTPPTSTTSWWWPSASPWSCSSSWPWCSACSAAGMWSILGGGALRGGARPRPAPTTPPATTPGAWSARATPA